MTIERRREAVERLSVFVNIAEEDLGSTTSALINEPFSAERLAEALGTIAVLRMRMVGLMREITDDAE